MSQQNKPSNDSARRVRIATSQLQLGMYVAELDRPWLGTPFLVQGFVVDSTEQLQQLRELCQHVYIDPRASQLESGHAAPTQHLLTHRADNDVRETVVPRAPVNAPDAPAVTAREYEKYFSYPNTIHEEFSRARDLHQLACQLVEQVQSQARRGLAMDLKPLRRLTTAIDVSLSHNGDALMWMTRIKHPARYHIEHAVNCCILAMAFGKMLQMSELEVGKLGVCGLLFDIGKMRLPPELLDKPGRYSESERVAMRRHIELGEELLRHSDFPFRFLLDVVRNHHMQPDGEGYPETIGDIGMTRFARIIAIVDAYDAMSSDRCYAQARTNADALKELYARGGRQFDRALSQAFMQLVGPYPAGTIVQLHNGLCGVTIGGSYRSRHLPRVVLLRDDKGASIKPRVVDLTRIESGDLSRDHLICAVLKNRHYGVDLEDPFIVAMMNRAVPEMMDEGSGGHPG